jgi:hypothetical protein
MQALTAIAVCVCAVGAITVPLVVLGVPLPAPVMIDSPFSPPDAVFELSPSTERREGASDKAASPETPARSRAPALSGSRNPSTSPVRRAPIAAANAVPDAPVLLAPAPVPAPASPGGEPTPAPAPKPEPTPVPVPEVAPKPESPQPGSPQPSFPQPSSPKPAMPPSGAGPGAGPHTQPPPPPPSQPPPPPEQQAPAPPPPMAPSPSEPPTPSPVRRISYVPGPSPETIQAVNDALAAASALLAAASGLPVVPPGGNPSRRTRGSEPTEPVPPEPPLALTAPDAEAAAQGAGVQEEDEPPSGRVSVRG